MTVRSMWLASGLGILLGTAAAAAPATEEEAPAKRGGVLTYTIPADAPPSFDGHREGTFATLHSAAPFYSVLIRINPENPSSTTDFVCARRCRNRPTTARPTPSRSATGSSSTTARR